MTYLLIALYLPDGSIVPELRTQLHFDRVACVAAQERYMTSQAVGSKWSICKKLKKPVTPQGE